MNFDPAKIQETIADWWFSRTTEVFSAGKILLTGCITFL